ncbi:UNVERIFIED_CONTAM: hypothetical protein K2H54_012988 [Gekko kuhli]
MAGPTHEKGLSHMTSLRVSGWKRSCRQEQGKVLRRHFPSGPGCVCFGWGPAPLESRFPFHAVSHHHGQVWQVTLDALARFTCSRPGFDMMSDDGSAG